MMRHVDDLFPILLKVLSDSSDEVVQNDLEVLAEIMSGHPTDNKLTGIGFQTGLSETIIDLKYKCRRLR